ncbi:probable conserved hypothetical Ustilaginaceae-specific protein [Ustilago trichophora]|uniref:Probable conserved hypothetical Ustilaginaceae-specific protein n=1 Tax=Ustilago trichophora TaxID=86804 RepID=A0A5C3EQ05_9BASI|nr:probable conserved hypothetical Ustilaginaceae-specific protein [Ustilago trichophora]
MRLTTAVLAVTLLALIQATTSVMGARSVYCTHNKDGTGAIAYRITKDCCAATKEHSTTHFNEWDHKCEDALGLGNGINLGRFVRCCGSRGAGSYATG